MKRIGMLTIHDTVNYGSLLQTYATYNAVKQICGNVEIINYTCKAIEDRETTYPLKSVRTIKGFSNFVLWHPMLHKKKISFHTFIKEQMKLSPRYNIETIVNANNRYDIFIVGKRYCLGNEYNGA